MSINTTPFLHLPQWTAEEKPSFLAEINQGYSSIDAGVRANQVAAEAAQTAAEVAKNQAAEAVEQGHANAAELVELRQTIMQLKNNFGSASLLNSVSLTFEKNPDLTPIVTLKEGVFIYNRFCANLKFVFKLNSGTYPSPSIILGKITSIPANLSFRGFNFSLNMAPTNGSSTKYAYLPSGAVNADGTVTLAIDGLVVNEDAVRTVWMQQSFPVQTVTGNQRSLLDNCLYIKE